MALRNSYAATTPATEFAFVPMLGGGRHEMLNEINREEVRANLLAWILGVLEKEHQPEAAWPVQRRHKTYLT